MKKVALATSRDYPLLPSDEQLLVAELVRLNISAHPLVWDGPDGAHDMLEECAAVVIRSCWDYHYQPERFLEWITMLEQRGVRLFNPPSVVRWNLDKTYLRSLESRGVRIPPTVWLEAGASANLSSILAQNRWPRVVIKPVISATAWRTLVVESDETSSAQAHLEQLLQNSGAMVQLFLEEVMEHGEWSFIFFSREYSHAVLKRAAAGDFRVQEQFGGQTNLALPSPSLIRAASEVLEKVSGVLLYARIDGVVVEGEFIVMELELIEPSFYLDAAPRGARRFAKALASIIEKCG